MLNSTKGLIVCVISGIAFGAFFPFLQRSLSGDFGLGSYAGLMLFGIGILSSTIVLNFYFMNIAIHGGSISFNSYLRGKPNQHFLGFAAGAIWALGALGVLLALSVPNNVDVNLTWKIVLPIASVVLAALCGLVWWKEHSGASGPVRRNVLLAIVFFLAGLAIFAFSISRTHLATFS
jgi:glucose uptake protein